MGQVAIGKAAGAGEVAVYSFRSAARVTSSIGRHLPQSLFSVQHPWLTFPQGHVRRLDGQEQAALGMCFEKRLSAHCQLAREHRILKAIGRGRPTHSIVLEDIARAALGLCQLRLPMLLRLRILLFSY